MRSAFLLTLLTTAVALGTFGPATAPAQSSNASLDDYQESVPGAGGGHGENQSPPGGGGEASGGGSHGGGVPPQTAEELQSNGAAGEALSDFADETGPAAAAGGHENGGGAQQGGADDAAGADTAPDSGGSGFFDAIGDTVSAVLTSSEDEGGLGVIFPVLLGAALLGTLGLFAYRRRRD